MSIDNAGSASPEVPCNPPLLSARVRAQRRSINTNAEIDRFLRELDAKEKEEETMLESPLQINEGMRTTIVQDAQFMSDEGKKHETNPEFICVQILLELLLAGETIGLKNTEPVLRKFAEYPNAEYSRDRIEEYMRKALLWPIQRNYVVFAPIS